MGSQVRPKWCSRAISAACSIESRLKPYTWAIIADAIEHAEPTSAWQPASAPEIDALNLIKLPNKPATASPSINLSLLIPASSIVLKHEGIIPDAPQVGAVTISPPEAFSSATA